MKTKLILLMTTILMIVACGKGSGTSTTSNDTIKQEEGVKETGDTLKSSKDFGNMPTEDKFYDGMLDIFCKRNYQKSFNKRFKHLLLEDLVLNNDSTVIVSGPLTFYQKETGDETEETEFKATITRIGQNKFRIYFENKGEKGWDDINLTINYIQMKKNENKL